MPALTSGVEQLTDGGQQLKDGLAQLNSKVPTLSDGVNQLNNGMNSLYAAVTHKNDQGKTLATGITELKEGIQQLEFYTLAERNGNPNMTTGVAQMADKMAKLNEKINQQVKLISSAFLNINMGLSASTLNVNPADLGLPEGETKVYPLKHFEVNQQNATTKADADLAAVETANTAATSQADLEKLKTAIAATDDQATKDALSAYLTSQEADKTAATTAVTKLKTDYEAEKTAKDAAYSTVKGYLNFVNVTLTNNGVDAQNDPTGLQVAISTFAEKLATLNAELNDAAKGGHPTYSDAVLQLKSGLEELDASVNNADPSKNLVGGITQLKDGMNQLAANVPALSAGVGQLFAGSVLEADGLNQLNSQTPTLADGVQQLKDGTTQLVDGSAQLATGLTDGYQQIAATNLTEMTADMFAAPTKTVQKRYTFVENYGAALAPFVLALALFIAIVIFNFAYPMKRKKDDERSVLSWMLGKLTIATTVAVLMGLIEAGLMMAVGLQVNHVLSFFGVTILFALAAMYLTMFLNVVFGRLGIFMALGLLTLSGSGGLFPQETVSPLYISLQKFLPMTYAINGYRQAISSGIASSTVSLSIGILLGIIVVSLCLLLLFLGVQDIHRRRQINA